MMTRLNNSLKDRTPAELELLIRDKERENLELKHKFKMEELKFERESQRLFFENQMSAHRIKRADRRNEFIEKQGLFKK